MSMKQALKELFVKHSVKHSEDYLQPPAPAADADPPAHSPGCAPHLDATSSTGGPNHQGLKAPAEDGSQSSVIAVAEHCPPAMLTDTWSLAAFEIRSKMYAGHISSVYRAVHRKSSITVGLKLYKRSALNDMERHQIAREIWLHIQLAHASIIALYAAWKDANYIYLVLEWAPEGNVFTYLQQQGGMLPEAVAVPMLLVPTMSALDYIHQLGMIHRDVKPENILLTTSYQIKLADFGLSIHSNYEVANTRLGTVDYLAPEILDCPVKHHPADHKANPAKWYTNKVDVWSVGILAYELLVGATPFEAMHPQQTLLKIRTQEVTYPPHLSPGAVSFMRLALVRDPAQRATMGQLLAHPWVVGLMTRSSGRRAGGEDLLCGGAWGLGAVPAVPRTTSCYAQLPHGVGSWNPADAAHNSCPQLAAEEGQLCEGSGGEAAAHHHSASDHVAPADVWRVAVGHGAAAGTMQQPPGPTQHQQHQQQYQKQPAAVLQEAQLLYQQQQQMLLYQQQRWQAAAAATAPHHTHSSSSSNNNSTSTFSRSSSSRKMLGA